MTKQQKMACYEKNKTEQAPQHPRKKIEFPKAESQWKFQSPSYLQRVSPFINFNDKEMLRVWPVWSFRVERRQIRPVCWEVAGDKIFNLQNAKVLLSELENQMTAACPTKTRARQKLMNRKAPPRQTSRDFQPLSWQFLPEKIPQKTTHTHLKSWQRIKVPRVNLQMGFYNSIGRNVVIGNMRCQPASAIGRHNQGPESWWLPMPWWICPTHHNNLQDSCLQSLAV